MTRIYVLALVVASVSSGCGGSDSIEGETVYSVASAAGNSFACATCHALQEPAADGFVRPGHPIANATRRATFKNGAFTDVREAANTCRRDWMGAPEWSADDPEWLALFEFLDSRATEEVAPALAFAIRQPPTDVSGGDMDVGREVFNGRCIVCHGEDAVGTVRAPGLVGELLTEELIARRVRTSGSVASTVYPGLTGGVMPFWAADRISDQELVDVIAFVRANDPRDGDNGAGSGELRECESTHAKIGQSASLSMFAHGVAGTATIVDDCTIEITSFDFDGQGIDVRFYSGLGGNYRGGFSMSENDLRRDSGYRGATVYAQLPEGNTLDDLDGISVWCVPAGISFGDGLFN